MFRDLIPQLADRFHLIGPDLLGFGSPPCPAATASPIPSRPHRRPGRLHRRHRPGPVRAVRLRLRRPDRVPPGHPLAGTHHRDHHPERQRLRRRPQRWLEPHPRLRETAHPGNRDAIRTLVQPGTTVWQYTHGVADPWLVSRDGYTLDIAATCPARDRAAVPGITSPATRPGSSWRLRTGGIVVCERDPCAEREKNGAAMTLIGGNRPRRRQARSGGRPGAAP